MPNEAAKHHATAQAPAYVDHLVLCELAWVLERSYNYPRSDVNACIAALLNHKSLKIESPELVRQALALYASQSADFSDYLLAARAQAAGYAPVLTFDKKAAKSATHELLR